jgi:hypothetical protein
VGCNSREKEAKAAVKGHQMSRTDPSKTILRKLNPIFFVKTYHFCLGFEFSYASKTINPSSGLVMMALH